MLYKLTGTIETKTPDRLVLATGPVAWELFVPATLLAEANKGANIELFTYLYVREKELELFGFKDLNQRQLFELLIDISGIGPKSALGVLSQATVDEVKKAVQTNNTMVFTSVPGIGTKGANRIILELKSKLDQDNAFDISQITEDKETTKVISALVNLGYTKTEARQALRSVDASLSLQERIKKCLKELGKG